MRNPVDEDVPFEIVEQREDLVRWLAAIAGRPVPGRPVDQLSVRAASHERGFLAHLRRSHAFACVYSRVVDLVAAGDGTGTEVESGRAHAHMIAFVQRVREARGI